MYFGAKWCGPCRQFGPVFEQAESSFPNVEFTKIDIDEDQAAAMKYGITSVPTIIMVENDVEIWRELGAMSEDKFTQAVQASIQES